MPHLEEQPWWVRRQSVEAAQFQGTYHHQVKAAQARVKASVRAYLERCLTAGAPVDEVQPLIASMELWPDQMFALRSATQLAHALPSACYWLAVDTIGALNDALGVQWPYLTQDDRARYLDSALCGAADLDLMLDRLDLQAH